jgi:hypothetical protein
MPEFSHRNRGNSNCSLGRDATHFWKSKVPFSPRITTSRQALLPLVGRSFEGLAGSLHVTMPSFGFALWQFRLGQGLSQLTADANFFMIRHKASERFTILQEDKSNVLVMGTINAVSKVTWASVTVMLAFFIESDYLISCTVCRNGNVS